MAAQDGELLAGGSVPEPGGLVPGRGEHARPVGREHRRVDRILMAAQDRSSWPVAASQSRAVSSSDAVSTRAPSGENTAEKTDPHGRAGPELLAGGGIPEPGGLVQGAVSTRAPSGENTAEKTVPSWPRRTWSSWPVAASQSRAVLSTGRGEHARPVGREHGRADRSLMAAQDLPFSLSQCRFVECRGGRGERSAVANQLDPVQGLEPEEHGGHGIADLGLLLGELGQPASLAAQRVLGLAVDAGGAVERALDEVRRTGSATRSGAARSRSSASRKREPGGISSWSLLPEASQRARASSSSRRVRRCGPRSRSQFASAGQPTSRASCASSTVGRRDCCRGAGTAPPQCVDQFLDLGIRERGPITEASGSRCRRR